MHSARERFAMHGAVARLVTCLACVTFVTTSSVACRSKANGTPDAGTDIAAIASLASGAAPSPDAGAVFPTRCSRAASLALPEDSWGAFPVFGDAIATSSGYVAAVTRDAGGKRVAGVAIVDRDLHAASFVELGAALADDPPPRIALLDETVAERSRSLVVTFVDRAAVTGAHRDPSLVLAVIEDGKPRVVWRAPQAANPELAFDVAILGTRVLVTWLDETAPASRVMVAPIDLAASPDAGRPAPSAINTGTDADSPRLVAREGGFWAAWIETSLEPGPDAGLEGAAESRAWGWIDVAALDTAGQRIGGVRRLTPQHGHVTTFDVIGVEGPGTMRTGHMTTSGVAGLEVVARDALEGREGEGAKLLLAGMRDETAVASAVTLIGQVGRGVPDFIATGPWVAYSDAADHARLVPFLGRPEPSFEPELENGRVLASRSDRLLVARKRDGAPGELRLVSCTR